MDAILNALSALPVVGFERAAQLDLEIELITQSDTLDDTAKAAKLKALKKDRAAAIKVGKALKAQADAAAPIIVMQGTQAVDINVAGDTFAGLLGEVAKAVASTFGKWIRLAAKMNAEMPFDWFDIEHTEVSENKNKLWKEYREPFNVALKGVHSNPSKAWTQLRSYAKNLRAGLSPDGTKLANGDPIQKAGAGQDTSTGGANANEARSPMLRNIEELTKLYKANEGFAFKAGTDDKLIACQKAITAALHCLGVDVKAIKLTKDK